MLQDRSLGLIQPDVAALGRHHRDLAHRRARASFNTAYAPHVGWSGAICVAASLQLAAAAETLRTFECMVYANPLRELVHASRRSAKAASSSTGSSPVPQGPGLGIEIDRDMLARHRIA